MSRKKCADPERDERIAMNIVVDCYDEWEVASGWYAYLQDVLTFPFEARCVAKRAISPLQIGEKLEVVDIGPSNECIREMFVSIRWNDGILAVPLSQLEASDKADESTAEAVNDWLYWVAQGREF